MTGGSGCHCSWIPDLRRSHSDCVPPSLPAGTAVTSSAPAAATRKSRCRVSSSSSPLACARAATAACRLALHPWSWTNQSRQAPTELWAELHRMSAQVCVCVCTCACVCASKCTEGPDSLTHKHTHTFADGEEREWTSCFLRSRKQKAGSASTNQRATSTHTTPLVHF